MGQKIGRNLAIAVIGGSSMAVLGVMLWFFTMNTAKSQAFVSAAMTCAKAHGGLGRNPQAVQHCLAHRGFPDSTLSYGLRTTNRL
jgi:hypothetical protein